MMNAFVPLTQVSQERITEVDRNCWAIVVELCKADQFATVEKVTDVLFHRYSVFHFSQLVCGELSGIPTMALLAEINRKISIFLTSNMAMASIITVADLEWDCVQFLQSFSVPTLYSIRDRGSDTAIEIINVGGRDPNEVDLDDCAPSSQAQEETSEEVNQDTAINCFEDYGVGSLLHHPLMWSYFHSYQQSDEPHDRCNSEQVMQFLIEYLSEQKWQHGSSNKFSSFSVEDFISYLCTELSVSHLEQAGILIRGDLHGERIALEHVISKRYTLYVETTKRELAYFNQQMQGFEENNRRGGKKRRKKATEEETADEAQETTTDRALTGAVEEEASAAAVSSDSITVSGVETAGMIIDAALGTTLSGTTDAPPSTSTATTDKAVTSNSNAPSTATISETICTKPAALIPVAAAMYEDSLNVYLPTGAVSITSNGAFRAGLSHAGDADAGIRIVENWELHTILPYVSLSTPADSGMNAARVSNNYQAAASSNNFNFNSNLDGKAAGRWGEAMVYQYLLTTAAPGSKVNWLNQQEESRACYDFILTAPTSSHAAQSAASRMHFNQSAATATAATAAADPASGNNGPSSSSGRESTSYIEVKSTRFADRNLFEISPNEWQFASADSRVPYHIYRVFSAGDPHRVRLVIIEDVYKKVLEGRVKLCMAV